MLFPVLLLVGCTLQQQPEYFLRHIDRHPEYVSKLPRWNMLGQTEWNGEIYIKNVTPLFTTAEIVLLHEQAHSFEIIASRTRLAEYKRFRTDFDPTYASKWIEIEEFPKAVIRALKGKRDDGAVIALKFINGEYRIRVDP